jgi:hypothetical protein
MAAYGGAVEVGVQGVGRNPLNHPEKLIKVDLSRL